jgi:hypothetical protein
MGSGGAVHHGWGKAEIAAAQGLSREKVLPVSTGVMSGTCFASPCRRGGGGRAAHWSSAQ